MTLPPPIRLLFVALTTLLGAAAAAGERPNVVVIVADDQGYGDLSCHGNPVLKTPHMDRLHADSVRFTDFHVAPMCTPTRGQLMTGRDAMKNGATAVCEGRSMMRNDLPTMADIFRASGYATGHFGKWHLGDSLPHRPQDRGFQSTLHHPAWGITSLADHWANSYFDPWLLRDGVEARYDGYCADVFFREAMEWIDGRSGDQPFFLYLPSNTPHEPNVCADRYSDPYEGEYHGVEMPSKFYGMIANLDENLGRFEAFLKDRGLRENTVLIYLSDNGTQSVPAMKIYNAGMRDRKTSLFEGGHRVPCFVRWPAGGLEGGRDVDELVQVQDLLPTIIDLCGLDAGDATFDGTSLAGLLSGDEASLPDRKLVIQYKASGKKWAWAGVLWKKWRLLGPGKLYHVGEDPHQDQNVADRHPDVARAMERHYDAWYADAKPLFDQRRWITLGSDEQNPVRLYAQDWVGDYCDNLANLTAGRAEGTWNVEVKTPGLYEIEFRRWPEESGLPLSSGYGPDWGRGPRGQRDVAAAVLRVGDVEVRTTTAPDAPAAAFEVRLNAGRQQLGTSLLAADGRVLCSAPYVKATRLPEPANAD